MTDRLYYDQTYLKEFDATVISAREGEKGAEVRLDRTAFYPTSGGQPYDTGVLGGAEVVDVYVDEAGEVWHVLTSPLAAGEKVHGEIDWARRFDHMQQHAGEHMLAGAVHRQLGGHTIGLHLGAEASTIDVTMPDGSTHLSGEQIARLEEDVNSQIQRDVPIRCWFPEEEELKSLPLRKPPTVAEHVRIVAIGEEEMVACGGTHPSSAGQIGLVKVVDARPSRGKLRLTFLCGMRAYRDYQARMAAGDRAAELLSTQAALLPEAVERLQESVNALQREAAALRREQAHAQAEALKALAADWRGVRLISGQLSAPGMDSLREAASGLIEEEKTVALLIAPREEGGFLVLFARSDGVDCDVGRLLREACAACGGKGGGKPDFAQGSAPTGEVLDIARGILAG